ncbi:DUF411 domain-containing protein [Solimonas marina]|uniref:DUF411 domain-containing protein n=1 Tax=Solimonas marina TaxID=2714601 RepID=A0A969WFK0_9GAMM|nr:DUF411 domain-containing protein [Solimonas marina]NKF23820.1 DUF411 domain-containing protein [Solimonas marina]
MSTIKPPGNRSRRRRPRVHRQLTIIAVIAGAFALAATALLTESAPAAHGPQILVYAESDVLASSAWIQYLREQGFRVQVRYEPYVQAMHDYLHVPAALRGEQTALVDGYIVEGNVPADDIRRLIAEQPHARGLALLGTPARAPGMKDLGGTPGAYKTVLFDRRGSIGVFATH